MEKQVFYSVNFFSVSGRELLYLTSNLYSYSEYSNDWDRFLIVVRRECRDMELLLRKKTNFRGKVVFCFGTKPVDNSIVEMEVLSTSKELR